MSPSEIPPEVLAVAVALAVELQAAESAGPPPAEPASRWRWADRRWERDTSHRWS
ncbi:MAG TPA: hypothetical protein VM388_11780 [Acidimicrobiales bacterium]|nr:hypothetical protein [Acidimicrobiales bacterium]